MRDRSDEPFFIVGCPRSGTTLLRLMLNAHRRLAIPPESHWMVALAPRALDHYRPRRLPMGRSRWHDDERLWVEQLTRYPTFGVLGVDPASLAARVASPDFGPVVHPSDHGGAAGRWSAMVRATMALYLEGADKPRWGDKTPPYVRHLPLLRTLFPRAKVIHLVRDGRAVAASLAESSGQRARETAVFWRQHVRAGLQDAQALPQAHLQVRLEALVDAPEATLRRICHFLGEEFDTAVLDHRRTLTNIEQLNYRQRHLVEAPTAGLRDWTRGLDLDERQAVEAVCGPLLHELGYEKSLPPRRLLSAASQASRFASIARRAPTYLWHKTNQFDHGRTTAPTAGGTMTRALSVDSMGGPGQTPSLP